MTNNESLADHAPLTRIFEGVVYEMFEACINQLILCCYFNFHM